MEDMARLALIEQNIGDSLRYQNFLYKVLRLINGILQNPHDYDLRSIKHYGLKEELEAEAVSDYLKYLGFNEIEGELTYPKENTLNKLKVAEAVIERKLTLCYGAVDRNYITLRCVKKNDFKSESVPDNLSAIHILDTGNRFLRKIQGLFNDMLKFEDEELLKYTRQIIPISSLQMKAIHRMRDHQKLIKSGEIKEKDMTFDIALLLELMQWFKEDFFTWMNSPHCKECGASTEFVRKEIGIVENETCLIEVSECFSCGREARFARHNSLRTLLRTRRGRCGEWAACFTLLLRALRYDTRFIYDTTDHVWCEIFDHESNEWLHVDPCENKFNTPLMYCHGWGKKISYVIAVSRDDVQDVTWRYTMDHHQVLKRRNLCSPVELINALIVLREHRQRQVSAARRRFLAKRCLQELVQMLVERKPTEYESVGRVSGSKQWRLERGEIANKQDGHIFRFAEPGLCTVQYCTTLDKYVVKHEDVDIEEVATWSAGVYSCTNMFRKHETDWKQVYLARIEDESVGSISWRLSTANSDVTFVSILVFVKCQMYENGKILWTVKIDQDEATSLELNDKAFSYERKKGFKSVLLTAELKGGTGDVAWQHAQLFRQSTNDTSTTFYIKCDALLVSDVIKQ